jgi:alkylation response protein AidB-like acyl-CoA dehydrogenase
MPPIVERLRRVLDDELSGLPLPGSGSTWERFAALASVGAADLSVARLAEAHLDALAICAEANRPDLATGLLGVWAADGATSTVNAVPSSQGWRLIGTKRFCSGSTVVDRALVTAHAPDGGRLFAIDLADPGVAIDTDEWATSAFIDTATASVHLDLMLPERLAVGGPDFYLARPGFWHGAICVAACWAGGARGLLDRYRDRHGRTDPHALAHLGAMEAQCWTMEALLRRAAAEIDADPLDLSRESLARALAVRHMVESGCEDILTRLGRAGGPRPAVFDRWFAQQSADLALYVRQCHGERDLESLGRAHLARCGVDGHGRPRERGDLNDGGHRRGDRGQARR